MTDYKLQQRFAISSFWTWCDFTEKQADVLYNVLAGPESKLSDNAMRILDEKTFCEREQAISILQQLMDNSDENVRARAAICLRRGWEYRDPRMTELVIRVFSDPSEKVRRVRRLPYNIRPLLALLEIRDFDLRAKVREHLKLESSRLGEGTTKIVYSNPWTKALVDSVDLPRGKAAIEMLQKDIQKIFDRTYAVPDYNALMIAQAIADGGKEMIPLLVPLLKTTGAEAQVWHYLGYYIVIRALVLTDEDAAVSEIIRILKDSENQTDSIWSATRWAKSEKMDNALLGLARDTKDPVLKRKALEYVSRKKVDELIQFYSTETDNNIKREIASRLANFTNPGVAPVLRNALANVNAGESKENAEFASEILSGLARLGMAEDRPLFLSMLKSAVPSLRRTAIKGLALVGNKDDVPILGELLKEDKGGEIGEGWALALGRIGNDAAVKLLIEFLSDKDVRFACAEALAQQGRKEAIEVLFEELKNPSESARSRSLYAAYALTLFPAEEVLSYAQEFLIEPGKELNFASKWLLAWFGDANYLRDMREGFPFGEGYTSIAASAALARQGDLLAAEVGVYNLYASGFLSFLRSYAQLVKLFPDAPQIDCCRYLLFPYAGKQEAVDRFLAWWETNRFNLEFDKDKRVFKLIIPDYQKRTRK
jgi:HEAT repeat protein